jgi:hypothetical protein
MRLSTSLFQKIQKPLRGSGWCSGQSLSVLCGSEPARDKRQYTAFIQDTNVIVDVHREQARSYSPKNGEAAWGLNPKHSQIFT